MILDLTKLLSAHPYPGRGIVVGLSPNARFATLAYFIMGRSANSRNRQLVKRDDALYTSVLDPAKLEDPSLILYPALRRFGRDFILTNGDQTNTIYEHLERGQSFQSALETREFEPDAPNFTPRISAYLTPNETGKEAPRYDFSILKSMDEKGSACQRHFYRYEGLAGLGHFLHTYEANLNPLPSFVGEPRPIATSDNQSEWTQAIWDNLNVDNRISLYTGYLDLSSGQLHEQIINQYQ